MTRLENSLSSLAQSIPGGTRSCRRRHRRGAILVLSALLMFFMVALLAFSVDLGYIMSVRAEMDRAVDAAALAGAGSLIDGVPAAKLAAADVLLRNPVGSQVLMDEKDREAKVQAWIAQHGDEFKTEVGHWDPNTKTFAQTDVLPSAIHVQAAYEHPALFFARIFGTSTFEVKAEAIARYQPRDIAIVLDFSGSMSDDSELQRIVKYGETVRAMIVANLQQIYQQLGSPVYGTMTFNPVYVSSTDATTVKNTLGLRYKLKNKWVEVPYPYPSGSWDAYITYMTSSSNSPAKAGYLKKYGYLTLVNYWLEMQPGSAETPELWKTSEQPIATVKDAVGVFMNYINEIPDCDDRLALSIYNSTTQDAVLEKTLTSDFAAVQNIVTHRQAAHYDDYTNIGAGIRKAKEELQAHGRVGAKKMLVLMTDGVANRPTNETQGKQYALNQAAAAKTLHFPIFTISLGNVADKVLMQQIADITGGTHFNIPGGSTVTDYQDDLLEAFRKIADARPLLLVK
jgi:hypothetical protein